MSEGHPEFVRSFLLYNRQASIYTGEAAHLLTYARHLRSSHRNALSQLTWHWCKFNTVMVIVLMKMAMLMRTMLMAKYKELDIVLNLKIYTWYEHNMLTVSLPMLYFRKHQHSSYVHFGILKTDDPSSAVYMYVYMCACMVIQLQ